MFICRSHVDVEPTHCIPYPCADCEKTSIEESGDVENDSSNALEKTTNISHNNKPKSHIEPRQAVPQVLLLPNTLAARSPMNATAQPTVTMGNINVATTTVNPQQLQQQSSLIQQHLQQQQPALSSQVSNRSQIMEPIVLTNEHVSVPVSLTCFVNKEVFP